MMTFDEMLAVAGIAEAPAEWRAGWEAAQASFPAGGLPFTTDAFLDEINRVCRYADDVTAALRSACAAVRSDEALSRLAWLWHLLLYHGEARHAVRGWPRPAAMGEAAEMFPAVVQLSGLPGLFARHRARGIPEAVTRDTCRDLEVWMRHALRYTGAWGFTRLFWMANHCAGALYRLGRLQFIHTTYRGGTRAFRHREDRRVMALSEPGICYRRDGLVDGTNGMHDDAAWTATLEVDDRAARGYPVHPEGYAQAEAVTLPRAEWEPALAPGDPVLDIHIPADGKLESADCGASLQAARAFFPRYFPELPPARAFVCVTWMLDSQLARLLPGESNIVRFGRAFTRYPVLSDDSDPFFRVFGGKPDDLRAAPRDTGLRRAMLDFTLAGNGLRLAGGVILAEERAWEG